MVIIPSLVSAVFRHSQCLTTKLDESRFSRGSDLNHGMPTFAGSSADRFHWPFIHCVGPLLICTVVSVESDGVLWGLMYIWHWDLGAFFWHCWLRFHICGMA